MCSLLSSFLSLYFTLCLMCVCHMSLKDLLTYLLTSIHTDRHRTIYCYSRFFYYLARIAVQREDYSKHSRRGSSRWTSMTDDYRSLCTVPCPSLLLITTEEMQVTMHQRLVKKIKIGKQLFCRTDNWLCSCKVKGLKNQR